MADCFGVPGSTADVLSRLEGLLESLCKLDEAGRPALFTLVRETADSFWDDLINELGDFWRDEVLDLYSRIRERRSFQDWNRRLDIDYRTGRTLGILDRGSIAYYIYRIPEWTQNQSFDYENIIAAVQTIYRFASLLETQSRTPEMLGKSAQHLLERVSEVCGIQLPSTSRTPTEDELFHVLELPYIWVRFNRNWTHTPYSHTVPSIYNHDYDHNPHDYEDNALDLAYRDLIKSARGTYPGRSQFDDGEAHRLSYFIKCCMSEDFDYWRNCATFADGAELKERWTRGFYESGCTCALGLKDHFIKVLQLPDNYSEYYVFAEDVRAPERWSWNVLRESVTTALDALQLDPADSARSRVLIDLLDYIMSVWLDPSKVNDLGLSDISVSPKRSSFPVMSDWHHF